MKVKLFLTQILSPKGRHWWLGIFLWVVMVAPAQAGVILRVAIERGVNQVKVGSSTTAIIKDGTGHNLGQLPAQSAYYAQPAPGGVALDKWRSPMFWIEPSGKGFVYIGDHWYRGKTLVVPTDKGLTAVNYVDLEEYLYSVVGAEVFSSWPIEALKAQAVTARTFAVYKRETAQKGVYDVGATPDSWQAYKGVETEASSIYQAVDQTAGQVLVYNNQPILSVFHNCSGGHTENVEDIWGENNKPYLRGVEGYDRDEDAKECKWAKTFSSDDLGRRVFGAGNVKSITPELTQYGSTKSITFVGDQGTKVLRGDELRNKLGLKSQRFQITQPTSGSFQFDGSGWGHGLGMSQWGARNLAQNKANYLQILAHYYQGASLAKLQVK